MKSLEIVENVLFRIEIVVTKLQSLTNALVIVGLKDLALILDNLIQLLDVITLELQEIKRNERDD